MIRYKYFDKLEKLFKRYKNYEFRHTGLDYLYLIRDDFTIKIKYYEVVEIEYKFNIIMTFKFTVFTDIDEKIKKIKNIIKLVDNIILLKDIFVRG